MNRDSQEDGVTLSHMLMLIALATGAASGGGVHAQTNYPAKAIRLVVPLAPGGPSDILARTMAQKLTESLKQTVVVDNRTGAGGVIGTDIAAKSPPDGYTLFMTSGSIVTANQHIYRKMPFDPEKDLAAVTGAASGPQVIAVHPTLPAKTLKEFIGMAKAKPKFFSFGSAGFSTQTHLSGENFMHAAGMDAVHIPYKGEGPALIDLVAGQIIFATPNMAAAIGFIQQNKLRALAVTSKERVKQLVDVPTVAETIPGFENIGWFGLMAPAGTPQAVIRKVHEDTTKSLQSADFIARLAQLGMVPYLKDPQAFAQTIKAESVHWARIAKARNLVVQ